MDMGGVIPIKTAISREKALELVYTLYSDSLGTYVVAGVEIDKELEYVLELTKNKKRFLFVFQPKKKIFKQLIRIFREYYNVRVIKDYTFNCKKYLSNSSVERFYALNIVNWKPQHFLTLLKGIYYSLSETGKLIFSLYVSLEPHAKNRKDVVDTPEEVLKVLNNIAIPIAFYYDDIGILALYVFSKCEVGKIYRELRRIKKEIDKKIEGCGEECLNYKMFFS